MRFSRALQVASLVLAAAAVMAPAIANGAEQWWFDHREGRFPTPEIEKVVEPSLLNLKFTDEKGNEYGPCKNVAVKGKIRNKINGMGEGSLNEIKENKGENCPTSMGDCEVKKLEPIVSPGWGVTLNTDKSVEVSNFSVTIELEGKCVNAKLPKESKVTGTVKGTFISHGEPGGASVSFSKAEVGTTKVSLDGPLGFGTELTALPSAKGFKAKTSPAVIDGVQTTPHVFEGFGSVECQKATFSATAKDGDTTVTVKPAYGECTWALGPATVEMNGCTYLLHVESIEEEGFYKLNAPTDIVCPEGEEIEVEFFMSHASHTSGTKSCMFTFGPTENQGLEIVELTNKPVVVVGETSWMELHMAISEVRYTRAAGSFFLCGPETQMGILEGGAKLTGTTDDAEKAENGIAFLPG